MTNETKTEIAKNVAETLRLKVIDIRFSKDVENDISGHMKMEVE